jgi:hypothetical protein
MRRWASRERGCRFGRTFCPDLLLTHWLKALRNLELLSIRFQCRLVSRKFQMGIGVAHPYALWMIVK